MHLNTCSILNNKCVFPTFLRGDGFFSVKDGFARQDGMEQLKKLSEFKVETFEIYSSSVYTK